MPRKSSTPDKLSAEKSILKETEHAQHREFSPEYTANIFQSEKFLRALKIAGAKTKRTGYETGFDVTVQTNSDEFFIEDIESGFTDSLTWDNTEIIKTIDKKNGQQTIDRLGEIVLLHFHPDVGPIIPSSDDLEPFTHVDKPGLVSVGSIDSKSRVSLLTMKPSGTAMEEDVLELEEALDFTQSQEEVADILERSGFSTALLDFTYDRKSKVFVPNPSNREKILQLGPVIVSRQKVNIKI